jgi:glucosylceramidase
MKIIFGPLLFSTFLASQALIAEEITCVSTTEQAPWVRSPVGVASGWGAASAGVISVNSDHRYQTIEGFGGCFNELGWDALTSLSPETRKTVMRALFDPLAGCGFTFGRMPIGASDFAKSWYSLDDTTGDYALKHFSCDRDRQCLIPYIKDALAVNPRLKIWGSAWSPPAWMKENNSWSLTKRA